MKNLVFATALAMGSLSPVLASPPIFHDGIMEVIMAQDFTEIELDKLPDSITKALEKDHAGAVINKAYMNDEDEYKLEVTFSDGTNSELYVDAEGNWIDM
ncbi:hypothetical protein [Arenibacter sp. F26102]|uniref:hypothetical protein n=1 Tax=Arenibacter sp. F26102 TaxID=2926416 RepID=UPI001FF16384|nr:hypothetical protein [Arenibacter sp. F26102]